MTTRGRAGFPSAVPAIPWALVMVAPVVTFLALAISGGSMLVTGTSVLWPPPLPTLSEAILLRDQGEMAKQISSGADPNIRYDVIDVLRPNQRVRLTPLEAAVATGEPYIVRLVVSYGARVDATNAVTLYCLAQALRAAEIASFIERLAAVAPCEGVALPYR